MFPSVVLFFGHLSSSNQGRLIASIRLTRVGVPGSSSRGLSFCQDRNVCACLLQATCSSPTYSAGQSLLMKRCIIRRIIPSNTAPCRRAWQLSRTPKPTSDEFQSLLSLYAKKPPRPVPLSRLLSFANPLTKESVLASASYALSEMPRRLYQRVRAFDEKIPFIVGTNPFIARTHELARSTFQTLASFPPIITMEDNEAFSRTLENLVEKHSNDIPTLAKG
jgi:hypothetical protein